jgi:putative two-component system response regulator
VLLDVVMSGLDGFGVMAQLRPQIALRAVLAILVLTAEITPEAKRRALSQGATDFLTKPLDTVEVLLRIHNLLQTQALGTTSCTSLWIGLCATATAQGSNA